MNFLLQNIVPKLSQKFSYKKLQINTFVRKTTQDIYKKQA